MNTSAKGSRAENERKRFYEREGYIVQRSAGSMGVCDLVLVRPSLPCTLIEVKSASVNVWRASRSAVSWQQFVRLMYLKSQGYDIRYDIRFNGGRWASFDELPPDGIFRGPKE